MRYAAIAGLALLPLAPVVQAADLSGFGAHVYTAFPRGDLGTSLDGNPAFDAGVHLTATSDGANYWRPRVDATFFPSAAEDADVKPSKTLGLGCDYLRFLDPGARYVYGLAGLSIVRWNFSDREARVKPGLRVGVGFRAQSRVAIEAQYEFASVLPGWTSRTLQVGLLCSF